MLLRVRHRGVPHSVGVHVGWEMAANGAEGGTPTADMDMTCVRTVRLRPPRSFASDGQVHVGGFADGVFMDDFCRRMRPLLA